MNSKWIASVVVVSSTLVASAALAQEKDQAQTASESKPLAPATHSVELTLGTGYAQGFGNITANQPSLTELGQAGGAIQVGVGYRIIPRLTLGVYGAGSMFGRADQVDSSANLYSAAAGVQADWHFIPGGSQFDPWVSLGGGWRGYWIQGSQGTTSLQGLEIAKLQVGLDYRIDQAVAIGPVVGADLTTFLTQSTPTSNGFQNVSSPQVNTFIFAGLQGRFDIPTGGDSSKVASR